MARKLKKCVSQWTLPTTNIFLIDVPYHPSWGIFAVPTTPNLSFLFLLFHRGLPVEFKTTMVFSKARKLCNSAIIQTIFQNISEQSTTKTIIGVKWDIYMIDDKYQVGGAVCNNFFFVSFFHYSNVSLLSM